MLMKVPLSLCFCFVAFFLRCTEVKCCCVIHPQYLDSTVINRNENYASSCFVAGVPVVLQGLSCSSLYRSSPVGNILLPNTFWSLKVPGYKPTVPEMKVIHTSCTCKCLALGPTGRDVNGCTLGAFQVQNSTFASLLKPAVSFSRKKNTKTTHV